MGDPSPAVLRRPLPFQQLKTVVDISVTWYVRHGFAIGREKSRGNDVCNEAHKYANRVVANEEHRGFRCVRATCGGGYRNSLEFGQLTLWLYNLIRRANSLRSADISSPHWTSCGTAFLYRHSASASSMR